MSIWKRLDKPVMCLAPMEGVTDTVFRRVVNSCGRPDVSFTEFTSVDGMYSRGYEFVARRLEFEESEKPLIAQIWGLVPEHYEKAADVLVEKGFDGIDINMGCPVRDVVKKGACSGLIENMPLAGELIQATKKGVGGRIPVSVKTRLGLKTNVIEEWARFLLSQEIDALIVHGRTSKQMSKVPADWDEIAKVVKIRDEMGVDAVIIGNGDVKSLTEAESKVENYGVDGVMIGRGIFEDPWLFHRQESFVEKSVDEKLALLLMHLDMFQDYWGEEKHFDVMKKFFKIYVNEFYGAKHLRVKLMECDTADEVRQVVAEFDKI